MRLSSFSHKHRLWSIHRVTHTHTKWFWLIGSAFTFILRLCVCARTTHWCVLNRMKVLGRFDRYGLERFQVSPKNTTHTPSVYRHCWYLLSTTIRWCLFRAKFRASLTFRFVQFQSVNKHHLIREQHFLTHNWTASLSSNHHRLKNSLNRRKIEREKKSIDSNLKFPIKLNLLALKKRKEAKKNSEYFNRIHNAKHFSARRQFDSL